MRAWSDEEGNHEGTSPGTASATYASTRCPIPTIEDRPTPSSRITQRRSAAPTCTSTRCSGRSSTRATSSGTSRWASSRRSAREVTDLAAGDRVVMPFNISCGHCWMCDQELLLAVRDHAGPRARHGRRAVRLHQALRPGARRPGRVPAGAAGAVRPDQGARGAARRAVPVPVRRAAHRLAGRRVRRRSRRAAASPSSGSGPIGADVARASPGTAARPGDRRRPRARAARAWRAAHGVEVVDLQRAPTTSPTASAS